jgi:hypothetical protein
VTLVRPVVGVRGLVVVQVFPLNEAHAAQVAGVWPQLRRHMDPHVHPQVLFAEELFAACVAGKILDADVLLDNVLLEGVLVLESGGALGANEHVVGVDLVDVALQLLVGKESLGALRAHQSLRQQVLMHRLQVILSRGTFSDGHF